MKWFVYLAIIFGIFGFSYFYELPNICDNPVSYRIGEIDSRFNLTQTQVLGHIREAEQYWEEASGKDLFNYAPSAKNSVLIQMLYDERQEISTEINSEQVDVNQDKTSLQARVNDFNRRSREHEKRVEAFNNKISNWNKNSSQTEEEYKKLVAEQAELEQQTKQINAEARTLQQSTNDVNVKIDKLNGNIATLQTVIKSKPEEGLYESASNTISIYYNNSRRELVHTIEHELGHSLGLNHLSNPLAIMYVQTNDTLEPTEDDLKALNLICKKETVVDRVKAGRLNRVVTKILSAIMQK